MSREVSAGLMPGSRSSKEDVNYRTHEKCSTCGHFVNGHCDTVAGNISPDTVCDRWELSSSATKYRDKEFFEAELKKGTKKYTTDKQGKGAEFYKDARDESK